MKDPQITRTHFLLTITTMSGEPTDAYAAFLKAHENAHSSPSRNFGTCELKPGAYEGIRKVQSDFTVAALLRSPSLTDASSFAHTLVYYISKTWNLGLDAYYFDILDAMVCSGSVLGPTTSAKVAQDLLPSLISNKFHERSGSDSGNAEEKLGARMSRLYSSVSAIVAAARSSAARRTLTEDSTTGRGIPPGRFTLSTLLEGGLRAEFNSAISAQLIQPSHHLCVHSHVYMECMCLCDYIFARVPATTVKVTVTQWILFILNSVFLYAISCE